MGRVIRMDIHRRVMPVAQEDEAEPTWVSELRAAVSDAEFRLMVNAQRRFNEMRAVALRRMMMRGSAEMKITFDEP
jgi:hypothetical protein